MSLTVLKRNLEEKLMKLGEETDKLVSGRDGGRGGGGGRGREGGRDIDR